VLLLEHRGGHMKFSSTHWKCIESRSNLLTIVTLFTFLRHLLLHCNFVKKLLNVFSAPGPTPYFLNKESTADVVYYWASSHSTSNFISWKIATEWMGVIRRLEVRIEMHCTGISKCPMRTAYLHTSPPWPT